MSVPPIQAKGVFQKELPRQAEPLPMATRGHHDKIPEPLVHATRRATTIVVAMHRFFPEFASYFQRDSICSGSVTLSERLRTEP